MKLHSPHFTNFLCALALFLISATGHASVLQSLCYHDVKAIDQVDLDPDQFAISPENLLKHFEYIKANGFNPVSVQEIIDARDGGKDLPDKALLLTFDDGYLSFYTEVYPLLQLYNYPAVLAVVGSWLETPETETVQYGDHKIARSHFVSWEQLREMQSSGLIEIASHSYNLHRGVVGNPQGNKLPAAVARLFDSRTQQYESDEAYRERIRFDLVTNSSLLERQLGKKPRVMVWPYGAYTQETNAIAEESSMATVFTLEETIPNKMQRLDEVHRMLISANPEVSHLAWMLNRQPESLPARVVHVDLDYIYDPNPVQQEKNLGLLLERIKALNINTVYLQAFADPDGDGNASELYFPNRHLPVRADLFNRVAWQFKSRLGIDVYAWMPVMAFDLGEQVYMEMGVREYDDGDIHSADTPYRRLSPFNAKARTVIGEIYHDLAKSSRFQGLLFHDDAYLGDFEDFHPDALKWYRSKGITASPQAIVNSPELVSRTAQLKTDYLIDFTLELADIVRYYQPLLKTARNIYAQPVLNPESENWFAQNFEKFVSSYDMTAIMAMPYMEKAEDPHLWLALLLETVKMQIPPFSPSSPDAASLGKVLFELQAFDWERKRPVKNSVLTGQMRFLLENGINNLGYYPDNVHQKHPDVNSMKTIFSLKTFPYVR